jgi:hypothetical protein
MTMNNNSITFEISNFNRGMIWLNYCEIIMDVEIKSPINFILFFEDENNEYISIPPASIKPILLDYLHDNNIVTIVSTTSDFKHVLKLTTKALLMAL